MEKTALITGVSGQDGSYLAELLLAKGYQVVGLTRDPAAAFTQNIAHLENKIKLVYTNYELASLLEILKTFRPSELYNCAGQTYVTKSWEMQDETLEASAILPTRLLEAVVKTDKSIRFFQASSCEVFSLKSGETFNESSPLTPGNPYGCSKAYAHNMLAAYRQSYGLYATVGTLFHHESPRRHENFASQKVVQRAVGIKLGKESQLVLGNMDVSRDWGYAPDYARAIELMMRQEKPEDFVICTGVQKTLRSLVETVFGMLDLDYKKFVTTDPKLVRPSEPLAIQGSNEKARKTLGWAPSKTFEQMLDLMVRSQLEFQKGNIRNFANEKPF